MIFQAQRERERETEKGFTLNLLSARDNTRY